jgi:hypothetical protein
LPSRSPSSPVIVHWLIMIFVTPHSGLAKLVLVLRPQTPQASRQFSWLKIPDRAALAGPHKS